MEMCDDRSGNQSGYTGKMLHPATPSGRQAQWQTLQYLLDALYPGGVRVILEPLSAEMPKRFSMDPPRTPRLSDFRKIDLIHFSRRGGLASAAARMRRLTPEQRSAIASKASRARWERARTPKQSRKSSPGDGAPMSGHHERICQITPRGGARPR
jgi:hypothetical protein